MKTKSVPLLLLCGMTVAVGLTSSACANEHGEHQETKITGSIRPEGKPKGAALVALAKISFADAQKAALAAVPGTIIKAELEVEEGNLLYSFEIVTADKKVTEVEIDAGNGKVHDIDQD